MAAQSLAANGAKVYIVGRTQAKLERVVDQYNPSVPGELVALQGDVSTKQGVQDLYKALSQKEMCLCVLVNNAGIASARLDTSARDAQALRRNLFERGESTFAEWTDTYATNVASLFFTTTAFLPLLEKSTSTHPGWSAAVLNITSISGMIKSAQRHFAYNASKAAAIHLSRMLAAELASSGVKVRVNSIAPGVFPSEMTTEGSDEAQKSKIPRDSEHADVPAGRPGKDEDMAAAVLFAVTNQFLNGENMVVDGGYTLEAGM